MKKQPLVILTGPTAVGKTALSIRLAQQINGEIISADSMQVYQYMDIGTAKVRPEEMDGIKHYLIDEFQPDDEFNVVVFQERAKKYIQEIYQKKKIPVIVGGTGFYIQAVLYDIDFTETDQDDSYREYLQQLAGERGASYLHDILKKVDPESAELIHANNIKKVIRALEFYEKTKTKISEHNQTQRQKESPYQYEYFVLNDERRLLYERIERRIDQMLEEGLLREVEGLIKKGYHRDLVSMQGLGYKEVIDYLEGRCTLEEAVYILKRDTRHFAKRQITWFKREKEVSWVDRQDFNDDDQILTFMLDTLRMKGIIE